MSPLLIDFLFHIRDECAFLAELAGSISRLELEEDPKNRRSSVKSLEIIGEAVKNLPESVRSLRPGVPWSRIARMRDRLTHGYFDIDYDFVWEAMTVHVPELRIAIDS